jgi:hypothetical protein
VSAHLTSLSGPLRLALCLVLAAAILAGCDGGPDPSPPRAPAESAKLPRVAPQGAPLLGYNENFAENPVPSGLIAGSGAAFVRTPLNWATVEPSEGQAPNWEPYDEVYERLLDAGVRPMWAISSAPCWASDFEPCDRPRTGLPPDAEHVAAFAGFAADVAERYPEALAIEIWNEPNYGRFWAGGLDPDLYAELLAASAAAIHEADPSLPVISAGLGPVGRESPLSRGTTRGPQGKLPFERFVDAIYGGGAGEEIDGFGAHLYPLIDPYRPPLRAVADQLASFRAAIRHAGGGDPPIWVTETGLSSSGQGRVGGEAQGRDLVAIYRELAGSGVRVIAIHRLFDEPGPESAVESGFGTVRSDHTTLKPAYCDLAALGGHRCR